MDALLRITGLNLYVKKNNGEKQILRDIELEVLPSEVVAIVGESGSGKSMLARSVLGLQSKAFRMTGKINFQGEEISAFSHRQLTKVRGKNIGMVFQEPIAHLDPTMRMGRQISEPLLKHQHLSKIQAWEKVIELLTLLKINDVDSYLRKYPHQISGGQAQRGMVATAVSCIPQLIIADEPTSALDIVAQHSIVALIKQLSSQYGLSVLFITHDLDLARCIADRIVVMESGCLVESGTAKEIFENPKSAATKKLMDAILADSSGNIQKCSKIGMPLVRLSDIRMYYKDSRALNQKGVDGISLNINEGECLGVLGESGCGKTTLAKLMTRLIKPNAGSILYQGQDIFKIREYPKLVQIIFQDATSSLDPRMRIQDIVAEGIDGSKSRIARNVQQKMVDDQINRVGLDSNIMDRYPHELSGGQRQRVSIARALIMNPKLLICDEPTSYLDSVSQFHILELLMEIKKELNLTLLFITHQLKVLGKISDRIAVMAAGKIVELADTEVILRHAYHPYTRLFTELAKVNNYEDCGIVLDEGETNQQKGCPFYNRCLKGSTVCMNSTPELRHLNESHDVACHFID